jgi:hypothetical protein
MILLRNISSILLLIILSYMLTRMNIPVHPPPDGENREIDVPSSVI